MKKLSVESGVKREVVVDTTIAMYSDAELEVELARRKVLRLVEERKQEQANAVRVRCPGCGGSGSVDVFCALDDRPGRRKCEQCGGSGIMTCQKV